MSKRVTLLLLVLYELVWLSYTILFLRSMLALAMHATQAEISQRILAVLYIIPFALLTWVVLLVIFFRDLRARKPVGKGLWGTGFVLLGVIVFPLYFFLVIQPASISHATPRAEAK
jgi:glucan phosphoethanolaminetransferase (alkaline phosphatase superfamily)